MDSKARTNQGGSVLIFTVVAVVMAAALAGAIYIVHQQGDQAQSDAPVFEGSDVNNGTVDAPGADTETETPSNDDAAGDTPRDTSDPAAPSLPGSEDGSMPETGTSELPATGPTETLLGLLVIGLLTFGVVSYRRSRAALLQ